MKQFSKDLGNVSLVPKGKWSREQEYERLALVYNAYDNLGYVAKTNVPSGVDIENSEYWQPMNVTGYGDNNFINLTTENENGTITAFDSIEEAVATIFPINRRAGATLSFFNLNTDRLDRQAEFELWQFNSTDLANWENKDYWNNIYYNWNVFVGWYISADALNNHVKFPNVGQYAYVGSNLNNVILYQCRTNAIWTNTGIKARNYISAGVKPGVGTIGYEQLNDNLKQLFREKVNVTNFPDDEDIASVDNMLKLKDREADAAKFQSKGYVILRKNLRLVNGVVKNILTQDMINQDNTIYDVKYDFEAIDNIQFKPNSIVLFNGGSFNLDKVTCNHYYGVVNNKFVITGLNTKGNTNSRPVLSANDEGYEYYDTTLKKKILWNGTAWVNIDGTDLAQ